MQITEHKTSNTNYAEFYLSLEEFEKKETKEKIKKYKINKYNVAIFITGKENYPEILKKIIYKQVELSNNVC